MLITGATHRPSTSTHESGRQLSLVAHIINRLAIGGLENGLVNLINHMPSGCYRHVIVCLTDASDFREQLRDKSIRIVTLHKRDGHDMGCYFRMWKTLRSLKPAIVHTRNLPTLEFAVIALAAGVAGRVHGEHGRDMYDLDGSNPKYRLIRKALRPMIHHFTAVSQDLSNWLIDSIGVHPTRVSQIYNGVNVERFYPRSGARPAIGPTGFMGSDNILVGTVGRMQEVKDQVTLVRAFIHLINQAPSWRNVVRLVIIGDGPLRKVSLDLLNEAGVGSLAWLPGERADVPEIMRNLDLFVLPSKAEGISNTILEAMASGLPVVATHVGGNPELVEAGRTGMLVPPGDPPALAEAIDSYLRRRHLLAEHGRAARARVEAHFSMAAMVNGYLAVYDHVLAKKSFAS